MANLSENRISHEMSEAEVEAVILAVKNIGDSLQFLISATATQRQSMPKMNVNNTIFVADAINVGKQNAKLFGETIASVIPEMEKDYHLFNQLDRLELSLSSLLEQVRDTRMVAGSEAFTNALMIYSLIKPFAKAGFPGTEAAYKLLKERFEGQGGSGTSTTEVVE
jgi:hypothetical protein